MDIFTEQIVKHRMELKDAVIDAAASCSAMVISMIASYFWAFPELRFFVALAIILSWFVAYRIVRSRNLEYEYTLTNNYLDIDVIKGRKKRKTVVSIDVKKIDICAALADVSHRAEYKNPGVLQQKLDCTGDGQSGVYFFDYEGEKGKVRVLIQPEAEILEGMSKFNPRKIFIYQKKTS